MAKVTFEELLEAGVHFGHLKRKWNPNMAPYIFTEQKGIHIIDLNKTIAKLDEAANAMRQIAKSGKKILFVATKKQAKDIVAERVQAVNMPYVTERWSGPEGYASFGERQNQPLIMCKWRLARKKGADPLCVCIQCKTGLTVVEG